MKYDNVKTRYVTVIIKCNEMQAGGDYFRKYRNVEYTELKLKKLIRFLASVPGGWSHFNVYDKLTREFIEQIKNN